MAEEKKGVSKSSSNGEMSPQEDGTKVPLTADGAAVEVKFTSETSPNGDARIHVGPVPTFSGLNKEELMKYSNDPFWIRLRWFLFILFWFAWLMMLVVAIIVIVLAPRCKPPTTLQEVQESPMLQYSNIDDPPHEFVEMMNSLKVKTAYVEEVIDKEDFSKYVNGREEKLEAISKELTDKGMNIATNFMDDVLPNNHVWLTNDSYSHFFEDDGRTFNYSQPGLVEQLQDTLGKWVDRGFASFIMNEADTLGKASARDTLNQHLQSLDKKGAVVSGLVDMGMELPNFGEPNFFQEFLQTQLGNGSDWKYYLYNPLDAVGSSSFNYNHVPLVTLSLFLIPGTPILRLNPTHVEANTTIDVVSSITKYRQDQAVQFGDTYFVNVTMDENVVAYTRVKKGVPGYAVAVNLDSQERTVDFSSLKNLPEKGKLKYQFVEGTSSSVEDKEETLSNVVLKQLEGKIIQFVPVF